MRIFGPTQVVVVQLLPALAAEGVQVATGILVVLLVEHVVVVHELPAVSPDAAHDATGTLVVLLVEQVVVV